MRTLSMHYYIFYDSVCQGIKFTIYLFSDAKSVRGMFPSGLQPAQCVEVSFHNSLDTSNKSEQFTGRSGIQEKVIEVPRIIENERLKPDSFSGVRHKFIHKQTFVFWHSFDCHEAGNPPEYYHADTYSRI